ncbi:MAG: YggT family protein [Chloroflexota bacterium]|nr:YggT family protein [Chloroflexota bacterium]
MNIFIRVLSYFFEALAFIIFIRALVTWFDLPARHPVVAFLDRITRPILAPLRRIIPPIGMFDITPLVAIIILILIARLLLLI